jgi:hypothetical protein
MLEIYINA